MIGNKYNKIKAYTDGSCWNGHDFDRVTAMVGVALMIDLEDNLLDYVIHASNHGSSTRAEMIAVLSAIGYAILTGYEEIEIYTDSKYTIKTFNNYIKDKNHDLTLRYISLRKKIKIDMLYVNRNSGDTYNEMADEMAGIVRKNMDEFLAKNVKIPIHKYMVNETSRPTERRD